MKSDVLIVGGGIAGLACARLLSDSGMAVTVLDKGRGPGGRTSTRRVEKPSQPPFAFDHGAQYFTVKDDRFRPLVDEWLAAGTAERWTGRIRTLEEGLVGETRTPVERYVGVPGMSALTRWMGSGLDVRYGRRVAELTRRKGRWRPTLTEETMPEPDEDGSLAHRLAEGFAVAVVALPAPQAAPLLTAAPSLAGNADRVTMEPVLAVLAGFSEPLALPFDGAFVTASPLSWVARNSSKPGRPEAEAWVLHATAEWSERHLEEEPDRFAPALIDAFEEAVGADLPEPIHLSGHRWRYARARRPLGEDCLLARDLKLGVCGDWCPGERVEGAFLSGEALARRILDRL